MKSLKRPKGSSKSVNGRRADTTVARKEKRQKDIK